MGLFSSSKDAETRTLKPAAARAYQKAVREAVDAYDDGDRRRHAEASDRATDIFYDPRNEAGRR